MISNKKLLPWFLAARPKTLAAAFVPVGVATAYASFVLKPLGQSVSLRLSLFALISSVFIQIATNFVNDAVDFKKGADSHTRLGPVRVTQSGLLSARVVLAAAAVFFLISALAGIPLVLQGGLPVLVLGVCSILCGYLYTGGPYPLAYVGLGELFVYLFFGLAATFGVFYLQTGFLNFDCFIVASQIGLFSCALISINNFRDHNEDKKVGKMTLSARFGTKFSRYEILFFLMIPYILNIYWFIQKDYLVLINLLTLPLVIKISSFMLKENPSQKFNKYLGMCAGSQMLFGICLIIAFIFSSKL